MCLDIVAAELRECQHALLDKCSDIKARLGRGGQPVWPMPRSSSGAVVVRNFAPKWALGAQMWTNIGEVDRLVILKFSAGAPRTPLGAPLHCRFTTAPGPAQALLGRRNDAAGRDHFSWMPFSGWPPQRAIWHRRPIAGSRRALPAPLLCVIGSVCARGCDGMAVLGQVRR